jgi:DNA-binding HxlR family transcriptional regulator
LRIIARKWSYMTLRALRTPMTFSDLQRALRYITNHILTREIKLLMQEKLIILENGRYRLTPAGKELHDAVEPLTVWAAKYAGKTPCPPDRRCATCPGYGPNIQLVAVRR